jgi:fumarylacetoacetase
MNSDPTLNPDLRSWVESANDPGSDFPIQNLPLCCFEVEHPGGDAHGAYPHTHLHNGVAIGDQVLDVTGLVDAGLFDQNEDDQLLAEVIYERSWLGLAIEPEYVGGLRRWLQNFLRHDSPHSGQQARRLRQRALRPIADTTFRLPTTTLNYTDFYASVHHATNVGSMFRPEQPLLPNYKHVPIGYHGRASSLVASGTEIVRPWGQQAPPADNPGAGPSFGACAMLDYELELGAVIARGNELGHPEPASTAEECLLGVCLLNDWSARDIQKWEYQPLGPFLAKNFATTAGPFLVTMDALKPFRVPGPWRGEGDPRPLPYLWDDEASKTWGIDITLEVHLRSEQMRQRNLPAHRLSRGTFKEMYWTFAQMVAHHTSNGCNLVAGDLLGSGTISGTSRESRGSLLELTWDGDPWASPPKAGTGRSPITLPTGETRTFLQDGDEVIFTAWCEREGFRRIGFGECRGTVVAKPSDSE